MWVLGTFDTEVQAPVQPPVEQCLKAGHLTGRAVGHVVLLEDHPEADGLAALQGGHLLGSQGGVEDDTAIF